MPNYPKPNEVSVEFCDAINQNNVGKLVNIVGHRTINELHGGFRHAVRFRKQDVAILLVPYVVDQFLIDEALGQAVEYGAFGDMDQLILMLLPKASQETIDFAAKVKAGQRNVEILPKFLKLVTIDKLQLVLKAYVSAGHDESPATKLIESYFERRILVHVWEWSFFGMCCISAPVLFALGALLGACMGVMTTPQVIKEFFKTQFPTHKFLVFNFRKIHEVNG